MACIWPCVWWDLLSHWSPVYSPGWPLEWVLFNPFSLGLSLRGCSLRASYCIQVMRVHWLRSWAWDCAHWLLPPDMLLRQGKLPLEHYGSVWPTTRPEKKDTIKCNLFFFPTPNSIVIDATIQTNVLIYSFWELLEKWIKTPGYLKYCSYMF